MITIGTFDGVHIGHRAILDRLVETAQNEDLDSVLLTFFPHPRMVLQTDSNIKLINTISEKKQLLDEIGIDHLVIQPFTREFSRLTAQDFVEDILVHQLNARKIIIGYDHRFGRNRTADIDDLKKFGSTYGFAVEEISARELDDVAISSTKIRRALEDGDIKTANNYLGYAFPINGEIVYGKGIGGKDLNFPTANLELKESYKLIPGNGVYIVKAKLNGNSYFGITSIGTNPTVGGKKKTIETYFLDFKGDLYGRSLQLEFLEFIREESQFEGLTELRQAISSDEKYARAYIREHG